jgi:AcrR family transcriptional regulator
MTELVRARGRPRDPAARAAILRAAAALLDEGGLTAVTMEGIARRAGVGKPTIYRHWPNAAAVAMAAFLETTAQPDRAATANTALDELRLQLAAIACTFAARIGRNVKAMIAASQGETELGKAFRNHFIESSRQMGRTLLERAAAAGELRTGLDLEVTLDLIYGPLYYRLLVGHAPLDPGFTDALLDQVLQGLQADPVSGTGR